jgi:hypothetical protein
MRWFLSSLSILLFSLASQAQDYGGTGYVDMPSAAMMPDASIKMSYADDLYVHSSSISYQITPYLQGTLRYSGFHDSWVWDRNIEVKLNILRETDLLPELSLGIRDLGGTSLFGSEYLVATKRFDNFEMSLGVGWGRLSGSQNLRNPLTLLSSRFEQRTGTTGRGGTVRADDFFSGKDVGLFAGLRYSLPGIPMELAAEYSSDKYLNRFYGDNPESIDPINMSLRWNFKNGTSLALSRQAGDWGLSADLTLNTMQTPRAYLNNLNIINQAETLVLNQGVSRIITRDALRRGVIIVDGYIDYEGQNITLVIAPQRINYVDDLLKQVYEVILLHVPSEILNAKIIVSDGEFQLYDLDVNITDLRQAGESFIVNPQRMEGAGFISTDRQNYSSRYNVNWGFGYKQMFFDPDNPHRPIITFGPRLSARLPNQWRLFGRYEVSIYDQMDDYIRGPNSQLPRVRTNVLEYYRQGMNGLDHLYLSRRGNIDETWKYHIFLGYLEWMYAGAGIDLLNHDPFSSFAYGFHYSKVRQRDFDRGLGLRDLDAETLFVSGYWDSPFYDLDLAVHAGRYLAGDHGATFEVRRSFASGWQVGAFATFTNVSAEEFGEGSFDKGIYLSIPISNYWDQDLFRRSSNKIRFIQRDGGQYLDGFVGQSWFQLQQLNPRYIH